MRPPIKVMFSMVCRKSIKFPRAFQKALERPITNYRGVLLNLIVISWEKKRVAGRGEEQREKEREKARGGGGKVERLLFIQ